MPARIKPENRLPQGWETLLGHCLSPSASCGLQHIFCVLSAVWSHPSVCLLCPGFLGGFGIPSYPYLALIARTDVLSDSGVQDWALLRDGFLERVVLSSDIQSLTVMPGPGDLLSCAVLSPLRWWCSAASGQMCEHSDRFGRGRQ